jgi:hypothetical protein
MQRHYTESTGRGVTSCAPRFAQLGHEGASFVVFFNVSRKPFYYNIYSHAHLPMCA